MLVEVYHDDYGSQQLTKLDIEEMLSKLSLSSAYVEKDLVTVTLLYDGKPISTAAVHLAETEEYRRQSDAENKLVSNEHYGEMMREIRERVDKNRPPLPETQNSQI